MDDIELGKEKERNMGFDIFGVAPISEKGKYFGNTIWWWARLWDFPCFVGRDILTDKKKN